MARYTMLLNDLIELKFDLGMKSYPMYDENHRQELNDKILEHYRYQYEIGFETPQLFKVRLNEVLNRIMPYYNQLYKSCTIEFNPLYNIEITENFKHTIDNNSTGNNKMNNSGTSHNSITDNEHGYLAESDYPQQEILGSELIGTSTTYARNSTKNGNSASSINDGTALNVINTDMTNTGKTVESYEKSTVGSSAGLAFSTAIGKWRNIMINIDEQIIMDDSIQELFMCIW